MSRGDKRTVPLSRSANTVYYRLEEIVNFQNQYFGIIYKDVEDYLLKNGYTREDVDLLKQKQIDEEKT